MPATCACSPLRQPHARRGWAAGQGRRPLLDLPQAQPVVKRPDSATWMWTPAYGGQTAAALMGCLTGLAGHARKPRMVPGEQGIQRRHRVRDAEAEHDPARRAVVAEFMQDDQQEELQRSGATRETCFMASRSLAVGPGLAGPAGLASLRPCTRARSAVDGLAGRGSTSWIPMPGTAAALA